MLSEESRSLWNPQHSGIFKVSKVRATWQLDVLWSEFLIAGKKDSLIKIADVIKDMKENLSPDDYKKIAKPSAENKASLLRFLNGYAAAWSLGNNARQYGLVAYYLEAMLVRNEIKDQFTAKIVSAKLQELSADKSRQPK